MPDHENVGNACNGVPAPLLRIALTTIGCKKTCEDHDDIGNDSHEGVSPINSGQQTQVEQEERRGDCPVDISGKEDLTALLVEGIGDMVVVVPDVDAMQARAMAGCHAEVGQGGRDGDQGGDNMEKTLRHGNIPG